VKGAVGFIPRTGIENDIRRGATIEMAAFKRRSATQDFLGIDYRGLKSTATIVASLRDFKVRVRATMRRFPPLLIQKQLPSAPVFRKVPSE
jgi:hypothetical protein